MNQYKSAVAVERCSPEEVTVWGQPLFVSIGFFVLDCMFVYEFWIVLRIKYCFCSSERLLVSAIWTMVNNSTFDLVRT